MMRNPRRVVEFPIKGQLGIYNLVYTKGVITEYPRALVVDKESYELLNRKDNELKSKSELSRTMATFIRRKLGFISDGLAFACTSGSIGNIRVGLLFPACPWMRSTVTTVMLTLKRKYCLSALAYGLYGLKEM